MVFARPQVRGDLLVEETSDDQLHHVPLAGGQGVIPLAQLGQCRPLVPPHTVTLQCLLDGIEEILVAEGLGQELHRPGFHGPHGHGDVPIAREEDDRQGDLGRGQCALQV
jgi:hypothetical protein